MIYAAFEVILIPSRPVLSKYLFFFRSEISDTTRKTTFTKFAHPSTRLYSIMQVVFGGQLLISLINGLLMHHNGDEIQPMVASTIRTLCCGVKMNM